MDRKSRLPRLWSNGELKKFSHLFNGNIINVSAWKDSDKDGKLYRDYFPNAISYSISNYKSEARGFQGADGEIFLDLTSELPNELKGKYEVVFNHTALEHIFEVDTAFSNLCAMTSDIVIVIVPFLQPMHADYGDFWRFTPTCIQKMFEKNGLKVLYSSFNTHVDAGTYVFSIASKHPEKWAPLISGNLDQNGVVNFIQKPWANDFFPPMAGANSIPNIGGHLGYWLSNFLKKVRGK